MMSRSASISRRRFIDLAAGTAGVAALHGPLGAQSGPKGANDRIRMGLIGSGSRGRGVAGIFLRHHADVQYVAACDAYKMRLDQGVQQLGDLQKGVTIAPYEDYRRILDRQDVDAVLIATPDHWHCQMLIDAMAAGKDVYVEKPLSNTPERAVQALAAYRAADRVVQLGTQQRSGAHFQEAAAIVRDGQLGKVTHAVIQFGGSGYGSAPEAAAPVPDGLNWEFFQGPAPRHPFKPSRLRWRGWWDYGGGLITDWGVHLTDVALWYLNAQRASPLLTSGTAQYVNFVNPDRDQSPDAFSVSWQYPDFVMTFTNAVVQDWEFGRQGNYFFGPRGSLLVHRAGYELRPSPSAGRGGRGAGPGRGGEPAAAAPAAPPSASLQPRRVPWRESDGSDSNSATAAHTRNFLDCVKSRQKPVSNLEIGFYATLPTLLAVMAVRQGRSFKWDDSARKAIPV
jgi:predicted dehydrogenase